MKHQFTDCLHHSLCIIPLLESINLPRSPALTATIQQIPTISSPLQIQIFIRNLAHIKPQQSEHQHVEPRKRYRRSQGHFEQPKSAITLSLHPHFHSLTVPQTPLKKPSSTLRRFFSKRATMGARQVAVEKRPAVTIVGRIRTMSSAVTRRP